MLYTTQHKKSKTCVIQKCFQSIPTVYLWNKTILIFIK